MDYVVWLTVLIVVAVAINYCLDTVGVIVDAIMEDWP
jgi:hypothetical protein